MAGDDDDDDEEEEEEEEDEEEEEEEEATTPKPPKSTPSSSSIGEERSDSPPPPPGRLFLCRFRCLSFSPPAAAAPARGRKAKAVTVLRILGMLREDKVVSSSSNP